MAAGRVQRPAAQGPIGIARVGEGWSPAYVAAPSTIETAPHVDPRSLSAPGAPRFSRESPRLLDGLRTELDPEPLPGIVEFPAGGERSTRKLTPME